MKKNKKPAIINRIRDNLTIHMNLSNRLLYAFFVVALPIMVVVLILSYAWLKGTGIDSIQASQNTALETVANQLSYIAEDTKNLSRDLIFNNSVQDLLAASAEGTVYPDTSDAAYYIDNFVANRDFIDSTILASTDSTLYATEHAYTNISRFDRIQNNAWFVEMKNSSDPYLWAISNGQLMLTRKIYNTKDYVTVYGYEMIYISNDYIQEIWDSVSFGTTSNLILKNKNGRTMISNVATDDKVNDYSRFIDYENTENSYIVKDDTDDYLISKKTYGFDGWTLYMITPYSEVNDNIAMLGIEVIILAVIILVTLLLVSRFTARSMASPIASLAKTMDGFHGERGERVDINREAFENRTDEVGTIYRSFDSMTRRIETLIQEIYIKNLEKKDAELALLQSQINPHFIYNTLNSISWLALANDQDEISEMAVSLSDTLRLSLTKSNSPYITLGSELEYIKSYLVLMGFRYSDRLTVNYDIDESLSDCRVPKFILQPVIENALKHGIDHLEEGGSIWLSVNRTDDKLLITIVNDGDGIDLSEMKKLLDFNPDEMEYLAFESHGYGLQNIHRRIRIMCGMDYGLSFREIDADPEDAKCRTECVITLPYQLITDESENNENEDSEK